jgi:hypothetical protein
MKRFLAFVLIAALGVLTVGCETKRGTTEYKTETTRTRTEDGQVTGETTTTTIDERKTSPTGTSDGGSQTIERTTKTTTETTR